MSKSFSEQFDARISKISSVAEYEALLNDVKKYKEANNAPIPDVVGMYMALAQKVKELDPNGTGEYTKAHKRHHGKNSTPDSFIDMYSKQRYKMRGAPEATAVTKKPSASDKSKTTPSVSKTANSKVKRQTKDPRRMGLELVALCDKADKEITEADEKRIAELSNMKHPSEIYLDAKDDRFVQLLYRAAVRGYPKLVRSLVEAGVNVEGESAYGKTLGFKQHMGRTPLHSAAANGQLETVKALIELGADKNVKDIEDQTSLHLAAANGHTEVAVALFKAGADIGAIEREHGQTPLHLAAANGHTETVKALIDAGADKNAKNSYGSTLLHFAASRGHMSTVSALMDMKADVDAKNNLGCTPLHYAAMEGREEVVQALIDAGVDKNAKSDVDHTPLHYAAMWGREEVVQALIDAGADKNAMAVDGKTPLFVAIDKGQWSAAFELIESGVDVNIANIDGNTPLCVAAEKGYTRICEELIAAGADVNAKNDEGITPLYFASSRGHKDIVEKLLAKGADVNVKGSTDLTPLHFAVLYNKTDLTKKLLAKGADVNAKDGDDNTSLHFAARDGDIEIVQVLIRAGADVKVKNNEGKTAADLLEEKIKEDRVAVEYVPVLEETLKILKTAEGATPAKKIPEKLGGELATLLRKKKEKTTEADNKRVAELLAMKHPAQINLDVKDKFGQTPLHWAASNGRVEVVQALLKAKVGKEVKDIEGCSPLHVAVANGHTEAVQALIKAGADVNAKDNFKSTPLHSAAWKSRTEAVQALIKAGAVVNAKDEDGNTPLHWAAFQAQGKIAQVLIKAGADVNAKNNNGSTAVSWMEERVLYPAEYDYSKVIELEEALKQAKAEGAKLEANANGAERSVSSAGAGAAGIEGVGAGEGKLTSQPQSAQPTQPTVKPAKTSTQPTAKPAKTPTKSPDELGGELCRLLNREKPTEADKNRIAELMNMKHPTQINLNVKDKEGRTLLHKAARLGNVDAVQTLLKSGLDVNAMDKNGKTPMDEAAKAGEIDMVRVLISSGAEYSRNMRKPKRGKQKGVSPSRSDNETTAASSKVPQTNVAKGAGEQAGSNAAEALRSVSIKVDARTGVVTPLKKEDRSQ